MNSFNGALGAKPVAALARLWSELAELNVIPPHDGCAAPSEVGAPARAVRLVAQGRGQHGVGLRVGVEVVADAAFPVFTSSRRGRGCRP
jgi:hypothetical protein